MPPVIVSLVFAVLAVAFCSTAPHLLSDPDTAWHIAAGDLIRARGMVHLVDPWSFSAGNYAWLNGSWLWDVLESWVNQHFGLAGVAGLTALLTAAVCAGIIWQCMARGAGLAATMLIGACVVLNAVSGARPQVVTYLFTLIALALLKHVQENKRWLKLAWLAPLTALWANMHGGFVVMYVLIAAYKLDAALRKEWRQCFMFGFAGLACVLAALMNPYGVHIVQAVAHTLLSPSQAFIGEWKPMQFALAYLPWVFPVPLFLLLIRPKHPCYSTAEKLLGYFWLIMAAGNLRHYFLFLVATAPMLAAAMQPWFVQKKRRKGWALAIHAWQIMERQRLAALALALLMVLGCAQHLRVQSLRLPPPIDNAIGFIEAHYPDVRFLNAYNFGGYIVYATRGKLPVFIDGRAETAYPRQVIEDYMAYWKGAPDWEIRLAKYNIGGLFVERNDPAADRMKNRRGWVMVYEDAVSRVYVKEGLAQ